MGQCRPDLCQSSSNVCRMSEDARYLDGHRLISMQTSSDALALSNGGISELASRGLDLLTLMLVVVSCSSISSGYAEFLVFFVILETSFFY